MRRNISHLEDHETSSAKGTAESGLEGKRNMDRCAGCRDQRVPVGGVLAVHGLVMISHALIH